jgi:2-polyprenyl-3-methyl-5-hydroxy-6-metoxy-1,4-benzoquinol methylase
MNTFSPVWYHRLKYFLTPQLDLYKNIADLYACQAPYILDYGCGTGFGTIQFTSCFSTVFGVDSDLDVVNFARETIGHVVEFRHQDWCLDSPGGNAVQYEMITCIEVIEHVIRPEALVRAFVNNVASGGVLVLSTLNHTAAYRKNNAHVSKYTIRSFREFLEPMMPGVEITDFQLKRRLADSSSVTPMVAIWKKP